MNKLITVIILAALSMPVAAEGWVRDTVDSYLRCYNDSVDTFNYSVRNVAEEHLKDREGIIRLREKLMGVCIKSLKRDADHIDKVLSNL